MKALMAELFWTKSFSLAAISSIRAFGLASECRAARREAMRSEALTPLPETSATVTPRRPGSTGMKS
jgi:hypothetical protein